MRAKETYRGYRRNKCKLEKGIWSDKWYYSDHGRQKPRKWKRKKS